MTVKTKERFASVYMIKIYQLLHTASFFCEKVSLTLAFERLSRFRIFVKLIIKSLNEKLIACKSDAAGLLKTLFSVKNFTEKS